MRFQIRWAALVAVLILLLSIPALAVNIVPSGVTAGTGGLTTKGGQLAVQTTRGVDLFKVVKGTGATTIASTLAVTGETTLPFVPIVSEATAARTVTSADFGKIIACSYAGAITITLPNPSASTVGASFYVANLVDQTLTIVGGSTANNNNIIADGVLTSDNVSFATGSHKIGAMARVIGISATKWLIVNASGCTMTVEAAD